MPNKKCKKCHVPLEGFLYKLIARNLFGVKPSSNDPDVCNKCEQKTPPERCGCRGK